jgi:hypothetical protein
MHEPQTILELALKEKPAVLYREFSSLFIPPMTFGFPHH